MIESFRHRGLKQLFEEDNPRGVNADPLTTRVVAGRLSTTRCVDGMFFPPLAHMAAR
jgi:hypothetical protein